MDHIENHNTGVTPLSFGEGAGVRLLIANRGEIALRIQRTAKKMGIATVAIYSQSDVHAAFVQQADEAVLLEGSLLSETYLNIPRIIEIAKEKGVDAIHPGYGFLSENEIFIEACKAAGIIFIGPSVEAVHAMGNKIAAREAAIAAGLPVTPGLTGSPAELLQNNASVGFPLLIKAAAGGGGKGMKVVQQAHELQAALEATAREAKNYFGDDTVYMEKYIAHPRHIEVQILGDQHGNVVHLFERECSVQRRHQKIIEEASSPTLSAELRKKICEAAVDLAKSIGYYNAGTMEFLLGDDDQFYFLEMNTRVQVEHPVTECITGIDIVEQQIKIAQGEKLALKQEDIHQDGHAIECRIYAEDPEKNFLPSPGKLAAYTEPVIDHVRVDGMQLQQGDTISGEFDPMIAKLITWGKDREVARTLMVQALGQYFIAGAQTNINFLWGFMQHPDFVQNHLSTKYIDEQLAAVLADIQHEKQTIDPVPIIGAGLLASFAPTTSQNVWQQIGFWRVLNRVSVKIDEQVYDIEIVKLQYPSITFLLNDEQHSAVLEPDKNILTVDGVKQPVSIAALSAGNYVIQNNGPHFTFSRTDILQEQDRYEPRQSEATTAGNITSPMPGKVIKINVTEGQQVTKGDTLLIVEAMKMENNILCPADAMVKTILTKENEKVNTSDILIELESFEK